MQGPTTVAGHGGAQHTGLQGGVAVSGADIAHATAQIEQFVLALQAEGHLDEQFIQLLQLQDDSNPDFVEEVVQLYFEDSCSKLDKIEGMLSSPAPDLNALDQAVHQFKGSSASFGAHAIAQACIRLRQLCQDADVGSCRALLPAMRDSYCALKNKLDVFMQLERQRKALIAVCAR